MNTYTRKLLPVQPPFTGMPSHSSPPQIPAHLVYDLNPPFDSAMALTVLVILAALFFMGFFSIYIRRFSSDPVPEFTASNRRSQRTRHSNQLPVRAVSGSSLGLGLDPEVIRSLPVYSYFHGEVKYQIECAVCLGEFEEKEVLKVIPYCKHVFHLECIDTWLKMHVTCPVCRGAQFFEVKSKGDGGGGSGTVVGEGDGGRDEDRGRSTVENGGSCTIEVGRLSVRRSGSCSSLGESSKFTLERTSSS
ncbi:RING-H2 finger protein ATL57-like [Mercurialis annua]|uniref:RING-H2 finger protein ATL57-like n=1 Tax=Mercurialis annua TaxID=3986 RepID=UPI0021610782|nr:RING-H2 finger protein ATL57-like [Mercurialis annua]